MRACMKLPALAVVIVVAAAGGRRLRHGAHGEPSPRRRRRSGRLLDQVQAAGRRSGPGASPGRDLLITAAHCINGGKNGGYRQDIVFIPGYRDGREPFGVWIPAKLLVAPQWENSSDPDYDVGFIVLKPHDDKNIEEVLGANQLGINPGYMNLVRVTGYPASRDAPVTCVSQTSRQSQSQLRFDCDGFTGGISGSPWVTHFDPQTRTGTIVGVLGGYRAGGSTEAISYSAYLGPEVEQLYRQAAADEAPATG